MPLLSTLIAVPLVGAVALLFINNRDNRNEPLVRWFALAWSMVELALTLVLWMWFNSGSADFQFVERHASMPRLASSMPWAWMASACSWLS